MGNVSGKEEKCKEFHQEYDMKSGHGQTQDSSSSSSYHAHMLPPTRASQSPMLITAQAPVAPSQNPNQIMQIESSVSNETLTPFQSGSSEKRIPVIIRFVHGGMHVAMEGSWDNWMSRELLEDSGREFSIVKMLNAGFYRYRFLVDGQWTYAPDLPHERDDMGNVFNFLDLKDDYPENVERNQELECPSSPRSSYNNAIFTFEEFSEKLPELPPLLLQMALNQPSSSMNCQQTLQKPLSANLNHLYVKRDGNSQSTVALSSSLRFRSKFVTTLLYKPFEKARK